MSIEKNDMERKDLKDFTWDSLPSPLQEYRHILGNSDHEISSSSCILHILWRHLTKSGHQIKSPEDFYNKVGVSRQSINHNFKRFVKVGLIEKQFDTVYSFQGWAFNAPLCISLGIPTNGSQVFLFQNEHTLSQEWVVMPQFLKTMVHNGEIPVKSPISIKLINEFFYQLLQPMEVRETITLKSKRSAHVYIPNRTLEDLGIIVKVSNARVLSKRYELSVDSETLLKQEKWEQQYQNRRVATK